MGNAYEYGFTNDVVEIVKETFEDSEIKRIKASCGYRQSKEYVGIWQQIMDAEASDETTFSSR